MLSGDYVPIRAHVLRGELFSSWLTRLAHKNAIKPSSLLHYLFDDKQIINKDIDRPFRMDHIARLASICSIDFKGLRDSTLYRYDGILFTEREMGSNICLIKPSTKRMGCIVKPGVQFCPICIKNCHYYKLEYKVALRTICLEHKCYLKDQCGCCGAYINYQLLSPEHNLNVCFKCKNEVWMNHTVEAASKKSYAIEMITKNWIKEGIVCVNNNTIYSYLVLLVIRNWIGLLISEKNGKIYREAIGIRDDISGKFEYLNSKVRNMLLKNALYLLKSWPRNFLRFVEMTGCSSYNFYGNMRYVPYWYWSTIQKYIYEPHYVYTDSEVINAARYMRKHNIKITFANSKATLGSGDAIRNRLLNRIIKS